MITHNKKRNTLLLYEFITRSLIKSQLEDNDELTKKKLTTLKKFFGKGTQIHKEFKLMKALQEIKIASDSTIDRIFDDVRDFAQKIDFKALNKEKTKLINEIHNTFADADFYNMHVDEYVLIATIQNLLNEYHTHDDDDINSKVKISIFEDKIKARLQETKVSQEIQIEDKKIYNNLTIRKLVEKFNKKYANLNEMQKSILHSYMFGDKDKIKTTISDAKIKILEHINMIESDIDIAKDDKLLKKLTEVRAGVSNLEVGPDLTDKNIEQIIHFGEILNYDE